MTVGEVLVLREAGAMVVEEEEVTRKLEGGERGRGTSKGYVHVADEAKHEGGYGYSDYESYVQGTHREDESNSHNFY